jgi:uncharacterized protein involved in high-affinity Fe2+ transport
MPKLGVEMMEVKSVWMRMLDSTPEAARHTDTDTDTDTNTDAATDTDTDTDIDIDTDADADTDTKNNGFTPNAYVQM